MTCEFGCKGKRHVKSPETGEWQKCMCLLIQERDNLCRQARIPEDYWDLTTNSLTGFTPESKFLKNRIAEIREAFPHHIKLAGPSHQVKLVSYLLLKSQLLYHRGMWCALDEATTWFLTQDKRQFNRVRNTKILALFFGDEYTQQVHKYVLSHLVQYRSEPRFLTIWATSLPNEHALTNTYQFPLDRLVPGEWLNVPGSDLV